MIYKILKKTMTQGLLISMATTLLTMPAMAESLSKVKLKVGQAMMAKTSMTHQLIEEMARNITRRTDGNVTFKVFGPEVGDWTELERMTKRGVIDMQFNAHDTGLDPRWSFISLPFSVSTWDQVRKVFAVNGVMDEIVKPWAEESGYHFMGTWLNGLGSLGLRKEVIISAEQASGKKIRVPPVEIGRCYVEKMGFSPVTIPWAETPIAVATGLVDGWVGSGSIYMYDLFRDVAKVMVVTYDFPETWAVTFNKKNWDKLPKEYQKIITEETHAIITKHLEMVEAEEMDNQAKLTKEGWTIVNMADQYPDELAQWKKQAQECWAELAPIVGQENIDKLVSAINQ